MDNVVEVCFKIGVTLIFQRQNASWLESSLGDSERKTEREIVPAIDVLEKQVDLSGDKQGYLWHLKKVENMQYRADFNRKVFAKHIKGNGLCYLMTACIL